MTDELTDADRSEIDRDADVRPCPSCPDGNVWGSNGPTGATCKTCNGHAVVFMDGSAPPKDWRAHD
jgi:hypothetical protein